jgi:MFS transporter, FHS family, glucose/mannose:H+ symporter
MEQIHEPPIRDVATNRLALLAFFLSGISMSFLGATLPSWRYHLEASFTEVGHYFLSLAVGFILSNLAVHSRWGQRDSRFQLVLANALAFAGFVIMAAASWAEIPNARLPGLLLIGAGAGLSTTAIFRSIIPAYRHNAAIAANLAGVLFGSACLLTSLLMAVSYSAYPVAVMLMVLSIPAGLSAVWFARSKRTLSEAAAPPESSAIWRSVRNPGMLLFGLLLFFQFGNEWAIAGWLPLFLIRRLGMSPRTSLLMLAVYWTALLVGRLVSQWLIPRASRSVLMAGSILSALLGTTVLAFTNNGFGAVMGVLFAGAGFAPVFPLAVSRIGRRFPVYPAAFFDGLFSFAILGGLIAPWTASFFASAWGIEAVMILPMVGACAVFVLTLLILLEAKLSGPAGQN